MAKKRDFKLGKTLAEESFVLSDIEAALKDIEREATNNAIKARSAFIEKRREWWQRIGAKHNIEIVSGSFMAKFEQDGTVRIVEQSRDQKEVN